MRIAGIGLACIPLLLAGCGDMSVKKLWPFGGDTAQERSRTPANATEYQCAGGKRFYLRTLDGGASVWLILPDRELRLDRIGGDSASLYSNGIAALQLNGNEATLKDGPAVTFAGCKMAGSAAAGG
jgi:hypothetical protein